jgi:DNA-directed RNA polymerase specialized sigma24 family protein
VLDRHTATPDDVAIMTEEMDLLLDRLPTDIRPIALWKFEGLTNQEIAAKLDCTLRTVERKVSLIREAWSSLGPDELS